MADHHPHDCPCADCHLLRRINRSVLRLVALSIAVQALYLWWALFA